MQDSLLALCFGQGFGSEWQKYWDQSDIDNLPMGGLTKREWLFYNAEKLMISVRCRDPDEGEGTVEVRLPGHSLILSHSDRRMEV